MGERGRHFLKFGSQRIITDYIMKLNIDFLVHLMDRHIFIYDLLDAHVYVINIDYKIVLKNDAPMQYF